MRRLRIFCVLVVTIFAAVALSIALENPASSANAQSQTQPQNGAMASQSALTTPAPALTPVASNGIAPSIVASNIGIRSLAAAPQSTDSLSKSTTTAASAGSSQQLFVSSADKPNRVFSFLAPAGSISPVAAAASSAKSMTPVAGIGAVGSVGDGGAATSAQLDLDATEITVRSGVAVAADGTLYIADSGNATIRAVAGPASSEPGIIRSVAGRWAPRQNVELSQPMGIALDRAGNLFIADFGANAIDVLYGASSPKAGQLETLAHMVAPGSVAVTLDGGTVFASSPQTGIILAINTKTRAIRTPSINPAALFAAAQRDSAASRISPTGVAVDGAGNLFIAYSNPGAAYDEILRLDAFSSKVTLAARGLSSPGDISFDAKGNLFVANQGMRSIVRFNLLGAAAIGVILTPPIGACADSDTIFCDQLIGGTSPTQSYELTNNGTAQLTGITTSFLTGNTGDFSVVNSSCAGTLAVNASCAFNVAFTPTVNASAFQTNNGTLCIASATANSRCSAFTINYTGAVLPLAAAATGIADDFQIVCVASSNSSCFALPDSNFDKITIVQGDAATFQLQIVPDNTFSGPVTLVCPRDLPAAPLGTAGAPTTCGLSLGTTVTVPFQNTLTVDVVAGTPLAFSMTIQTTTTQGTQNPLPTMPAPTKRSLSLLGLLSGRSDGDGGIGFGISNATRTPAPTLVPASRASSSASSTENLALLFALGLFVALAFACRSALHAHPRLAVMAIVLIVATLVGCHHNTTNTTITPSTPTGTFSLTVQGSAQNGARGYTCTLTVAAD